MIVSRNEVRRSHVNLHLKPRCVPYLLSLAQWLTSVHWCKRGIDPLSIVALNDVGSDVFSLTKVERVAVVFDVGADPALTQIWTVCLGEEIRVRFTAQLSCNLLTEHHVAVHRRYVPA